jgi:hypothetical protein
MPRANQHQQYNQHSNNHSNNHSNASQAKCLPCKKMICTGVCTYRNRCHYIHDARIMTPATKGICRKKNKDENCEQKDTFFWPPMATTPGKESRTYWVPLNSYSTSGEAAVASLWHNFTEVCVAAAGNHEVDDTSGLSSMNPVTRRPRLSVFMDLAGQSRPPSNSLISPVATSNRMSSQVPEIMFTKPFCTNEQSNSYRVASIQHSNQSYNKDSYGDKRHPSPTSIATRSSPPHLYRKMPQFIQEAYY